MHQFPFTLKLVENVGMGDLVSTSVKQDALCPRGLVLTSATFDIHLHPIWEDYGFGNGIVFALILLHRPCIQVAINGDTLCSGDFNALTVV